MHSQFYLSGLAVHLSILRVPKSVLTFILTLNLPQRVQQGMALTPSEKLGALSTSRTDFIREILQSHVSETTLGGPSIAWEMSRGSDFRCISQAIYCMDKWASDPDEVKNQGSLSQVEKWLAGKICCRFPKFQLADITLQYPMNCLMISKYKFERPSIYLWDWSLLRSIQHRS